MEKLYYTAKEVAEMLDVLSVSHAYKAIREANKELSAKGFYVRAGRVSRKYLDSEVYDLAPKSFKQKLEEMKADAAERNQQRRTIQQKMLDKKKKLQQEM